MELLLGIVVGAAVVGIAYGLTRRRAAAPARAGLTAPADPLADAAGGSDLDNLGPGAVVSFEGRDFVVRGTVEFDEDGYRWSEHHLDDLEVRRWLSVDANDGTDVRLWQEAAGAEGLEPAGELQWDGATWKQVEHGRASFRSVGTTGLPAGGTAWYADLRHATDPARFLAFERWSQEGSWEVSVGEVVAPERLDVFPAGGSR